MNQSKNFRRLRAKNNKKPFSFLNCLMLMAFFFSVSIAFAQNKQIDGTISDEGGVPLPGATVIVKGSNNGTATDFDGKFTLSVPSGATTLTVTFIGFSTQEVQIGNQTTFNISLIAEANSLSEVVVVGYGTQKKRDLTGAVGSIKSDAIIRSNPTFAAAAIQGQVTGVNINKVKGRPGDGYTIDIRGLSNFGGSTGSEPLVVIDGVTGGDLNAINPNDIGSIDVLKDASSTAIYGSRGANGVIIVTTKKGKSGKAKFTYNGFMGLKTAAHLPEFMTAQQFYQTVYVDRPIERGSPTGRQLTASEQAMIDSGNSTDWLDLITGVGVQTSHTISVSGGSQNTTYDFSGGYLDEEGNTLETGYKRYTIKGGLESKINDKVRVGMTVNYAFSKQNLGGTEAIRSAYRSRPTGTNFFDDLQTADQASDKNWNGYAVFMGIDDSQVIHPLVEINPENFILETLRSSMLANAFAQFEPVKGLTFRSSISANITNQRQGDYRGTYTKSQKTTRLPRVNQQTTDISTYTLDNILTYKLNTGLHNITVTGLHSIFEERRQYSRIDVKDLPYRSLWHALGNGEVTRLESDLAERALISYMGRINYTFKDKYLLTLTGRTDGASVLSEDNKWQFFPSVAVGWRIGDEDFLKDSDVVSDLKLRVSYGEVGNATSISPYATQSSISQTQYDFDGSAATGFAINNLANQNLVWERSKELNIGLNLGLLNNRITTSIEVYNRKTVDLILGDKLPNSTGFVDVIDNVGEIENSGVEVLLNTVNVANDNFRWSSDFTFSTNKNKVTKLASGLLKDVGNNRFVGEAVNSLYYYEVAGIWQLDEAAEAAVYGYVPGQVKFVDQNNDNAITDADDRIVVGNESPDFTLGIRNMFNYKDFDFSFFVYTRQGVQWKSRYLDGTMGDISSDRYNKDASLNYWTQNNPTNDYYGLNGTGGSGKTPRRSWSVVKADFLRISDITLGYTLPQDVLSTLGLSQLRVYAQATNPILFTDVKGLSPEYNSGANSDDVPYAMYAIGLNLSF